MHAIVNASSADHAPHDQTDCYVNVIPPFVEQALAQLYGHVNSSLAYFRSFKSLKEVSTYVERNEDQVTCVLLFERRQGRATVLNEGITLDDATIGRFAGRVFRQFPDVGVIGFHQIESRMNQLAFPFQRHNATENFILPLPKTVDEYTAALGKATRRNIKRYMGKLMQDHPSFACHFYSGSQIDRQYFSTLLQMSEAKVLERKARFAISAEYAEGLWKLARQAGFVAVATIDGKVSAGLICFDIQSYYFAHVVAHDSDYDAYWLGTLCYYLTVCEAIRRGGSIFNMGQLHYDYKLRLLASKRDLDRIEIYRSYGTCIAKADCVVKMVVGGRIRGFKQWLLKHPTSFVTRSTKYLAYQAHQLRIRS